MSNNDVCKDFFMQYLNYLDSNSELVVRCVYMRMEDENLLKSTLYGMHNRNVDAFVALVLRNGTLPYLLMDGDRLIGFAHHLSGVYRPLPRINKNVSWIVYIDEFRLPADFDIALSGDRITASLKEWLLAKTLFCMAILRKN